jgi:hypothetical protein
VRALTGLLLLLESHSFHFLQNHEQAVAKDLNKNLRLLVVPPVPPAHDESTSSERGESSGKSSDNDEALLLATEMQLDAKLQDPKVVGALAAYAGNCADGQARGGKRGKGCKKGCSSGQMAKPSSSVAPKVGKASIVTNVITCSVATCITNTGLL